MDIIQQLSIPNESSNEVPGLLKISNNNQACLAIDQGLNIPKASPSNAESTVSQELSNREFNCLAKKIKENNKFKEVQIIHPFISIPYTPLIENFIKSFLSIFPIISPLSAQIHQHKGYFKSLVYSLIRLFSDREKCLAERKDPACLSVIALINALPKSNAYHSTLFDLQLHILAAVYSLEISDKAETQLHLATVMLLEYQDMYVIIILNCRFGVLSDNRCENEEKAEFLMTRLAFIRVFRYGIDVPAVSGTVGDLTIYVVNIRSNVPKT